MSAKIDKILPLLKIKVLSLQVCHSVYGTTGSLNQSRLLNSGDQLQLHCHVLLEYSCTLFVYAPYVAVSEVSLETL